MASRLLQLEPGGRDGYTTCQKVPPRWQLADVADFDWRSVKVVGGLWLVYNFIGPYQQTIYVAASELYGHT